MSRDVAELRDRGLLAGHITAAPAYGAEHEAISTVGALDAAARPSRMGRDRLRAGPRDPGLGTEYGHGGMAALDNAHAALALGLPTLLSPRISSSDPRPRHRGLSHHTATVLDLLLGSVGSRSQRSSWPAGPRATGGADHVDLPSVLDALHEVCDDRHDVIVEPVDLEGYAASGLPARTMGRAIEEDPLFFAARARRRSRARRRRGSGGLAMERIGSKTVYEGRIATVRVEEFRHPDGSISVREVVGHPGAVAMVAHDDRFVYLVRQPREATGEDALLELPAGKLDVPEEDPLDCARRELAEEVGKSASQWQELKRFYTSPGFAQEEVTVYLATGLEDASAEADEEERIEVVPWRLEDLDAAIEECRDAKSLIGLMIFRDLRSASDA